MSKPYSFAGEVLDIEAMSVPAIDKKELHPLRLAEDIGFMALTSYGFDNDHRYWDEASDNLNEAWNIAELGLATKDNSEISAGFLKTARIRAQRIKKDPNELLGTRIGATLLVASVTSFEEVRIGGKTPSATLGHQILYGPKAAVASNLAKFAREPLLNGAKQDPEARLKALGTLDEALTYVLLAADGDPRRFPYAVSPREDSTPLKNFLHLNHDLYTLHKGQKVPIQVKRNEEDADTKQQARLRTGVASIVLAPIIEQEAEQLRDEMVSDGDNIDWYIDYKKLAHRPDVFLAQCFEPNQNKFRTMHQSYAASLLIKRVGDAVINHLEPQFASIRKRIDNNTLPAKNRVLQAS